MLGLRSVIWTPSTVFEHSESHAPLFPGDYFCIFFGRLSSVIIYCISQGNAPTNPIAGSCCAHRLFICLEVFFTSPRSLSGSFSYLFLNKLVSLCKKKKKKKSNLRSLAEPTIVVCGQLSRFSLLFLNKDGLPFSRWFSQNRRPPLLFTHCSFPFFLPLQKISFKSKNKHFSFLSTSTFTK